MRRRLKQHDFTFCVKFLLRSLLYGLKLPNSFERGALPYFKLKGLGTSQHHLSQVTTDGPSSRYDHQHCCVTFKIQLFLLPTNMKGFK